MGRHIVRFVWVMAVLGMSWCSYCAAVHAVTPNAPHEQLLNMSPDAPLLCVHWFGLSEMPPATPNKTEQLFAEPEVRSFLSALHQLGRDAITKLPRSGDGPSPAIVAHVDAILQRIFAHPGQLYLARLETTDEEPPQLSALDCGVILETGGEIAAELAQELELQAQRISGQPPRSVDIQGTKCSQVPLNYRDLTLTWTRQGDFLLVTLGQQAMEQLLARRQQSQPPAWLTELRADLKVERPWVWAHLEIEPWRRIQLGLPVEVGQVLSAAGFSNWQQINWAIGLDGAGCASHGTIKMQEFAGYFAGVAGAPLTGKELASVPPSPQTAVAFRCDLAALWRTQKQILAGIAKGDEAIAEIVDHVRQATGLALEEDLLQPVGDSWTLCQTGAALGMLPTVALSVSVRDYQRLQQSHDALLELWKKSLNSSRSEGLPLTIQTTSINDKPAYFLQGMPIGIAWQLGEEQLIVATSIQLLKTQINRQADAKSLAHNRAVAPVLARVQNPLAVYYNDTPRTMQATFQALPMFAGMAANGLQQQGIEFDVSTIPSWDAVEAYIEPTVGYVARRDHYLEFRMQETLPISSMGGATAPVTVALLLPAIQAARSAARRSQSMNHLREIGLAAISYENAHQVWPAASLRTQDGKPGLSWRVSLLPYLGHEQLYKEFHLDEPWDSEHNRKLVARIPDVYVAPASDAAVGYTNYLAVRGEGSVVGDSADGKGIRLREITDGTSKTVWLVEVNDDRVVEWTRPGDFEYNNSRPTDGLGELEPGGVFLAAFVDGSVRVYSTDVDVSIIRAAFTRNGGENVNITSP